MRTAKMTPTERHCLETMRACGGELNKLTFGLWHGWRTESGDVESYKSANGFSTQTVQRLVDRGLAKFAGKDKAVLVAEDPDPFRQGCLNVDAETQARRKAAGRCTECGHNKETEPTYGHALLCPMMRRSKRDALEAVLDRFRVHDASALEVVETFEEFIKSCAEVARRSLL